MLAGQWESNSHVKTAGGIGLCPTIYSDERVVFVVPLLCQGRRRKQRYKSLFCSSETENDLRVRIIMNYAPYYLGAVRARHDEPSARSPSFALLEQPGLEALFSVRAENSEMG